jgi:hypothetical protein
LCCFSANHLSINGDLQAQYSPVKESSSSSLSVIAATPRLTASGQMVIGDVYANISNLEHGAGFLSFIEGGKLVTLECFISEDRWPENAELERLHYIHPKKLGSSQLSETKTRDLNWALVLGNA